jgi:hypothetical protein
MPALRKQRQEDCKFKASRPIWATLEDTISKNKQTDLKREKTTTKKVSKQSSSKYVCRMD